MENKFLKAALTYIRIGWYVFPCKPGAKTPITSNGFKAATIDKNQVEEWWKTYPNANVAISCGPSGLAVIDLDMKDGIDGIRNWQQWHDDKFIEVVQTTRAFTPSGGQHWVYKGSIKSSSSSLAKGVDTRGNGGYIVAAPSVVNGKAYRWDKDSGADPTELPLVVSEAMNTFVPAIKPQLPVACGSLLELVQQDGYALTKRSNQYEGPCPWCSGKDRFFVAWPNEGRDGRGRYACRQCGAEGDSVEWLIKFRKMPPVEAKLSRGVHVDEKYLPSVKKVVQDSHRRESTFSSVLEKIKSKPVSLPKVRCSDCRSIHHRTAAPHTGEGKWREWLECEYGHIVTLDRLENRVLGCQDFSIREAVAS